MLGRYVVQVALKCLAGSFRFLTSVLWSRIERRGYARMHAMCVPCENWEKQQDVQNWQAKGVQLGVQHLRNQSILFWTSSRTFPEWRLLTSTQTQNNDTAWTRTTGRTTIIYVYSSQRFRLLIRKRSLHEGCGEKLAILCWCRLGSRGSMRDHEKRGGWGGTKLRVS